MMFGRNLLATDGSPHAREASSYAQELALRDDAQVNRGPCLREGADVLGGTLG